MSTTSESLTKISLHDFLNKSEIENLKQHPSFSENLYEKKDLILKLISLVIENLEKTKENLLSKCLKWVKKEIQLNLEISPHKHSTKKSETHQNHPSTKTKEIKENIYKKYISLNDQYIENENFNIFEFSKSIGRDNVLPAISVYVLNTNNSFNIIPYNKFEKFIYEIAHDYHRKNPYHTDLHAADMVQTLFVYNFYSKFQQIFKLTHKEIISMFVAAMVHDVRHPGYSNNYLINTNDPIAIEYNDQNVLENYHVSEAFKILTTKPECNIFSDYSSDDYKKCRKNIIENVLHTDMSLHNKQFKLFKSMLETYDIKKGKNIEKLFNENDNDKSEKMKIDFTSFLIHSVDISNPAKPLEVYKIWAQKCLDEFLLQGDSEKKKGLAVSFNCDRNTVNLPEFQLKFIDAIVFPLFSVLTEYFPQLSFTLDNIKKNSEYFKKIEEDENKKK